MPDHVHDALHAGATRQELIETIGVAVLMGSAPSVMYGREALEAIEQFFGDPHDESATPPGNRRAAWSTQTGLVRMITRPSGALL